MPVPYVPNIPFTALDLQAKLISLLNADPDIQGLIVSAAGNFNPVLDDDPTTVDAVTLNSLAVIICGEGEGDATLGGPRAGKLKTCTTFAIMYYLWDNAHDPAKKRQMVRNSGVIRHALMRYRTVNGTGGQGQLWYLSKFRVHEDYVTTYYTTGGGRLSLTLLDLHSEFFST